MAVQAHYPSNVLLNRNGQEGNEYSMQQHHHLLGGFIDQSQMLFNNGRTVNPRKRGREVAVPINPLMAMHAQQQQSHSPHLIGLSQFYNHQPPTVVSTGLRLSFSDQQQKIQNQQRQQHPNGFSSQLSEDFAPQNKKHRGEIDQFLQAQGEQLRRMLADKMQRQYHELLGTAEESVGRRLREKDAEIEKASRTNAELEARAAQLSLDAQVWQAKARTTEATAATLQAKLQQAILYGGSGGEDGLRLGCGGGIEGQAEDAESAYNDPDRVTVLGPGCKACQKRVASVVLLPCRHLCLCTECDQVAIACPLCLSVRNSSVEVFLS